jgi:hypothetical protein
MGRTVCTEPQYLYKSAPYFYQHYSAVRVGLSDEQATGIRQTSVQVTNDVRQIK